MPLMLNDQGQQIDDEGNVLTGSLRNGNGFFTDEDGNPQLDCCECPIDCVCAESCPCDPRFECEEGCK